MSLPARRNVERAAIVGLVLGSASREGAEQSLDELEGLAATAGADVVLRVLQERARPDAATLLGRGKIAWLAEACDEAEVDLVVFDQELAPAQLRQIETRLNRRVVDRTQIILDIFAQRARSREGRLQVELAQLEYLMPRLVGSGLLLSRLGGGIGTRGPGETKLETDRRRVRRRMAAIRDEIDVVRQRRALSRERRKKFSHPMVVLVGYTNAGKTTLFNRLAHEHGVTSDALFVTLDPLIRRVGVDDRVDFLLGDTVGFIDRLPHALVAAFRATLEEVAGADLLLHVIDASSDRAAFRAGAVARVLEDVGAGAVPILSVFNKCDRIDEADRRRLRQGEPGAACVSARTGEGCAALLETVASRLALDWVRVGLRFDPDSSTDRRRIGQLYRHARVLYHQTADGTVSIDAEVPRRWLARMSAVASDGEPEDGLA